MIEQDPHQYMKNLGGRLEHINDFRASIGMPLMTRGELIRRDLQEGIAPKSIREHLEQELGKQHIPAPNTPTIEEETPDLRDLLLWVIGNTSEGHIMRTVGEALKCTDADWQRIQEHARKRW